MTEGEWKHVETLLKWVGGSVSLDCDGYKATLMMNQISRTRNGICVYVNGYFRGKWLLEDCEERRRFFQRRERYVLSKARREYWQRLNKKLPKDVRMENIDEKIESYSPVWGSFRQLKSHLIKNNRNIRMIA